MAAKWCDDSPGGEKLKTRLTRTWVGAERISSTTLKDVQSLYPSWEHAKPGERLAPTQGQHPSPRLFTGGASKSTHMQEGWACQTFSRGEIAGNGLLSSGQ